jgi:EAL domain-containing protein (putative c-di-GMP-specific phosphodiesterase class I)
MNLSVAQLADRQLCTRVSAILEEYHLGPERLMVEITEHATLARSPGGGRVSPEHTIEELRDLGASLCLDDFGTGYSSLTHIRRYPLTAIKIDRSFVAGVCDHPEDRAVIAAMVGMAGALDLEVVGEGVETVEQLAALDEIGCDKAQGYLIARPLPPDVAVSWVRANGADWRATRVSPVRG